MKKMNKKADIAITILVLGVIILCIAALLVFYLSEKQESEKIKNSNLQEVYNLAESVKFSDSDNYQYVKKDKNFIIEKSFLNGDLVIRYTLP